MTTKKWSFFSIYILLAMQIIACDSSLGDKTLETQTSLARASDNRLIATAQIANPSSFPRLSQHYYFSYYDLGLNTDNVTYLKAVKLDNNLSSANVLPSEIIDQDLDGKLDGVLVSVPLQSEQIINIGLYAVDKAPALLKLTQAELSHKIGGNWVEHQKYPGTSYKEYVGGSFVNVPELTTPAQYTDHSNWIRYEGPGIESDKIAYRIYADSRNGFDIFGKSTPEPTLQKIGQDGYSSYHEMQFWGMDLLKVGKSLGAGGFGLWHEKKLHLVSDLKQHKVNILENGALRSAFAIEYQDWKNPENTQNLKATFSMQAGSSLVHTTLDFALPVTTMAVGVVKHPETELITGELDITGKAYSYIASWGKQALDGSHLGMAIFFRKQDWQENTTDDANYISVLSPNGEPTSTNSRAQRLDYYFDAVWAVQSGITTKEEYIQYLQQQAEKLTILPRVRLKTTASKALQDKELTATTALEMSEKLANSEIQRKGFTYQYDGWDVSRKRLPKFEYDIVGLYPQSLYQLSLATGKAQYKAGIEKITASFIEDGGGIKRYNSDTFNIDAVAPGRAVLALYKETQLPKYKLAADTLRKQLAEQPRTSEGAFWHKQIYPYQLWLDGVYMGMPFMAEYDLLFDNGKYLHEVVKEFVLTQTYLKDASTGLYFHAWDESKQQEWADPTSGLSKEIWARGLGWFAMALVDVLDIIPASLGELRAPLLTITQDLATALVEHQDDATGTWWQIMDKPQAIGNYRESSASAMFTYFLAKAVSNNYIDTSYKKFAEKAYKGLLNEFVLVHENGTISMTNQCYVAGLGYGRDGSYEYYMSEPVWKNDPKGTGPFILAGVAMSEMLRKSNNEH